MADTNFDINIIGGGPEDLDKFVRGEIDRERDHDGDRLGQ